MSVFTFKGGVHPFGGKNLSKDKPVKDLLPEGDLVFPVSQHIGAPAVPVVAAGDKVKAGTLIAKAGGFVSSNIYSSVSGTVKKIEPRLVTNGSKCNSIIIENDGNYEEEEPWQVKPYEEMTADEIKELVARAGVVGMGGATFPTHVKFAPKDDSAIDYIIVNAAECEPYLTCDYRRLTENAEDVILGLKVILQIFPGAKGVFAVEDNKKDIIQKLESLVRDEPRISVAALKTKYPQGSERHIIYAVTKRYINSSMLPADVGVIVDNTDTIYAVKRAVIDGKPLTSRIATVTGDCVKEPGNFRVLFGTNMRQLIDAAGGFTAEPEKIIAGGPMMGMPVFNLDMPVCKGSSALLCFKSDVNSKLKPTNCISCGRCVDVCPERLMPTKLAQFSERGDLESFEKYNGVECMECGSCSYICPAKRDLAEAIKTMRKEALAARRAKK